VRALCLSVCILHAVTRDRYGKGRKVLPANVARSLVHVASKLGVFPYLDYHYAYSLGNYVKKDPSGSFEYPTPNINTRFPL